MALRCTDKKQCLQLFCTRPNTTSEIQIVNGGQTAASLFHAQKRDKADLSKIFVQMKLSIIDSAQSEQVVPKISQYANTQNRVNAADFFSNLWIPPIRNRIDMLATGIKSPIGIKVAGADLGLHRRARARPRQRRARPPDRRRPGSPLFVIPALYLLLRRREAKRLVPPSFHPPKETSMPPQN